MNRGIHVWTLLSGLALAVWGAGLLGDGLGWWDLELADLRFAGPILIIAVGVVVVVGALAAVRRTDQQS